jgi:D-proline reductase (dithiol) PrdB
VLAEAFKALYSIQEPGTIIDVPFKWRRQKYDEYDFGVLKSL